MTTAAVQPARPGDWVNTAPGLDDLGPEYRFVRMPTDRYVSPEIARGERQLVWEKAWQVAGRADEIKDAGQWITYDIHDQSFIIVRGHDGTARGFVNACRHRGNVICRDHSGKSGRFTCPYHLWSYDLAGQLRGFTRPDLVGDLDKETNGLLEVSIGEFAGFVWLNPDPNAGTLEDYLGPDVIRLLAPYRIEEFTTVMNVREAIDCNWKVVIDAFSEGYHIQGIHPQLLSVIALDPTTSRFKFDLGDHAVAMAPFEVAGAGADVTADEQVAGIRTLPDTFPSTVSVLPYFEKLVDEYRNGAGDGGADIVFPEGVTARVLLQRATRQYFSEAGLDVSGLTDEQMSDNHGWLLFPNFFMTVRAGECHVVMAVPDPDGDPNRCIWHVHSHMWLPEALRDDFRAELIDVQQPGDYQYFLALQQDYEQMPRQQLGLRNPRLQYMQLVLEEVSIVRFHQAYERWMQGTVTPMSV